MPVLPIPNRCIWCQRQPPEISFNLSHVLPESVGNNQQILPSGVVCKSCNSYFGSKVEPALLSDPLFHAQAVFLRLKDPSDMNEFRDRIFDKEHPPTEQLQRSLSLKAKVQESQISLEIKYEIQGILDKQYTTKELSILSRAIHKIAFESLAWTLFVKGTETPIDLFSTQFDPIRSWAREGQPQRSVRPVLRRPAKTISPQWESRVWGNGTIITLELKLFGDWYAVNITSQNSDVLNDLLTLTGLETEDVWCITEKFSKLVK